MGGLKRTLRLQRLAWRPYGVGSGARRSACSRSQCDLFVVPSFGGIVDRKISGCGSREDFTIGVNSRYFPAKPGTTNLGVNGYIGFARRHRATIGAGRGFVPRLPGPRRGSLRPGAFVEFANGVTTPMPSATKNPVRFQRVPGRWGGLVRLLTCFCARVCGNRWAGAGASEPDRWEKTGKRLVSADESMVNADTLQIEGRYNDRR